MMNDFSTFQQLQKEIHKNFLIMHKKSDFINSLSTTFQKTILLYIHLSLVLSVQVLFQELDLFFLNHQFFLLNS
mgnify:CR=1 FL=1